MMTLTWPFWHSVRSRALPSFYEKPLKVEMLVLFFLLFFLEKHHSVILTLNLKWYDDHYSSNNKFWKIKHQFSLIKSSLRWYGNHCISNNK